MVSCDATFFLQGYEKLDSIASTSVAHQINKFHHIRNKRQADTGKLFKDHGGKSHN